MKQTFIDKRFSESSLTMLDLINDVLDRYNALGYTLTLRQLYYQLVAGGHVENSDRSYKNIGSLVSDGRMAGVIDWSMIEDRGRTVHDNPHWDNPGQIVRAAANGYTIDKWADQRHRIIVMVEKQALEGILIPVCSELDISFSANKGYSSSSALYRLGRELRKIRINQHQTPVVLYLGDHDPSGIDMTRDVRERLELFSGLRIGVERLALNMDQVEVMNPPENPAKITDSRAQAYIAQFGDSSWELDAVEPTALAELVTKAVLKYRDERRWAASLEREQEARNRLLDYAQTWTDIHDDDDTYADDVDDEDDDEGEDD